jgi:O-antigen ligase
VSAVFSLPFKSAALMLCLVLPWLFGYTSTPTRDWWPWLFSAICAVAVALAWGRVTAQLLAATWLAAALISSLIGLLQYFGGGQHWMQPWLIQIGPAEAFANLRQRNQFASLSSIGLAALLACVAWRVPALPGQPARPAPKVIPAWAWTAAVLLALGNAVSSSRTGLLQWGLLLLLVLWWHWASRRALVWLTALALLTYLLALQAMPALLRLFMDVDAASLYARVAQAGTDSRLVLWSNMLTLIAQKPWLGWGWGELAYAHFMTAYSGARFAELLGNAHNLPLHLAVTLGIPAALLACIAAGWVVRAARPWRERDVGRQMAWSVLAVIGLHSLLEYPLWYGPFQLAVLLCAGWLWPTRKASCGSKRLSRAGRLTTSALVLSLLGLGWAGVEYWRVSQLLRAPAANYLSSSAGTPLARAKDSWLFSRQVQFAELVTTEVTPANALYVHALAQRVLHDSPEPLVIEQLLVSAQLAGAQVNEAEVAHVLDRYAHANPRAHALWVQKNAPLLQSAASKAPSTAPASAISSR